jgi:hypothetical protein
MKLERIIAHSVLVKFGLGSSIVKCIAYTSAVSTTQRYGRMSYTVHVKHRGLGGSINRYTVYNSVLGTDENQTFCHVQCACHLWIRR